MSDLYDWNPGVRATLMQIALMQMTDDDSKYFEDAPENYRANRVGWCYASQDFLAKRVGKSESQVQRDIKKFKEDEVTEERMWRDSNGHEHAEYHVKDDVVDARQRPEDKKAPRPKRNTRDYTEPHKG